jgi:hypothetical protein
MKGLLILVAVASMSLFSGCATLFSGKIQGIDITTSNNKRASIMVNGKDIKTPAKVLILRSDDDLIVRSSTKNCDKKTAVESSVNGVFFVNILGLGSSVFGGFVSTTVDYANNTMWSYDDIVINCK